jgi:TonB family protein
MAYRPMSRPDPFDALQPSSAPIPSDGNDRSELADGLSLAELATALSAHGGGALAADLALDLVLNEIVEHARLATGATAAAIALARGDEIVCRATTGANAPDLGVHLDVHSGLSGACVQSKKWQRCDDTETDSRVDAEVCRSLGVRSILVFPVLRADALLGVFETFSPRPNAFSDREIQTLQALSQNIVNNLDRAVEVLTPPAPLFPAEAIAATSSAAALESVAHLQVDPAHHDPEQGNRAQPDAVLPALDFFPETAINSTVHPRDPWMSVLTLTVIALALFLGWMMGYVRSPRASGVTKAKAAANGAALPVKAQSPEGTSAGVPISDQATPTTPKTAPVASGAGALPVGGLVVYENDKVIFRTPHETTQHSTKHDAGQPVSVPSKVADEYLIERVEPEYPESARERHIQGPVVLEALVGKDGAVEKLSMISGDTQLAAAATDAVRQWRFKPFLRDGSPEEFQTQITVSFRLP